MLPSHTSVVPVIMEGKGKIVTRVVAKQPVGRVKVIIVVPAEIPVVIPLKEPILATDVEDENHVPL